MLLDGVALAVTLCEQDLSKPKEGEPPLAERLRRISDACQRRCLLRTLLLDLDGRPPSEQLSTVVRSVTTSAEPAFNEVVEINYTSAQVEVLRQETANRTDALSWPVHVWQRRTKQNHANLAYFVLLHRSLYRFVLHVDSDVGLAVPVPAGGAAVAPWLDSAVAVLRADTSVLAVYPSSLASERGSCLAYTKRDCAPGRTHHFAFSPIISSQVCRAWMPRSPHSLPPLPPLL